jgi:spore protease
MSIHVRTDLAVEEAKQPSCPSLLPGVSIQECTEPDQWIHITRVTVENEQGAASLKKPVGTYITLETPLMSENDGEFHHEISCVLSRELQGLIRHALFPTSDISHSTKTILAVGLGNPDVTPDALGPLVLDHLLITRHRSSCQDEPYLLCGIVPRVMAQTGMDTSEIVTALKEQIHPDLILAIDALAARSSTRLGTTIQLTDTGIHPGSGVGNHRHSLTQKTLGVPILAIGVPTVVSAAAIVTDTLDSLLTYLKTDARSAPMADTLSQMNGEEQYQTITQLMNPTLGSMFVTPKDIDETIRRVSYTISEGINMALFPDYTT